MYSYIKGTITVIEINYVVIENNGIGYIVYVSNPYSYRIGEEVTIYVYQQVREDDNSLYGFKSKDDKDLFLKLISVKGLGPKMALPMFTADNKDIIYNAIENGDVNYLKKFPKIGEKLAKQIILDLKGKLEVNNNSNKDYTELLETLKSLGYKAADIKRILPKINDQSSIEEQVKEALRLLLKWE